MPNLYLLAALIATVMFIGWWLHAELRTARRQFDADLDNILKEHTDE